MKIFCQAQIYRHLVGGAPPVAGRVLSQLLKEDLARDFQAVKLDRIVEDRRK